MGLLRQTSQQVDPARIQAVAMLHIADDAVLGLMVCVYNHNHTAGIAQKSPDATLVDEALATLEVQNILYIKSGLSDYKLFL